GFLPFDVHAERIEVSDAKGVWLGIDHARIDLSARALISRRAEIGTMGAETIELMRLPEASGPPSAPKPLSETLQMPHLPMAVTVTRVAVGRLLLDAPIAGESIEAALDGHVTQNGNDTDVALKLHRTDAKPGNLDLQVRESGADPVLSLNLVASEPTGVLLNRALTRTDNLPLTASLKGEGRLAQWRGRLDVAAGQVAHLGADLGIAATHDTVVSLDGTAAVTALLPPELAAGIGDAVPIAGTMTLKEDGVIALEGVSLRAVAGSLTADAKTGGADQALAGHLHLTLPQLSAAGGTFGQPLQGAAELNIIVSGSQDQLRLQLDGVATGLKTAQSGADKVEAHLTVQWPEHPSDPAARIAITSQGAIDGIALPDAAQNLGRDLTWSIEGQAASDGRTAELTQLSAHGAGVDIDGAGRMAEMGRVLSGQLHAKIADLRPLTSMAGHPMAGELNLTATANQQSPDLMTTKIEGSLDKLQAGVPAADALVGGTLAIVGSARRGADGAVVLEALSLKGADADIAATGRFDPATKQLTATLDAVIASLQPVGRALGSALAGRVVAHVTADGALDQPRVAAHIDGSNLASGTATLEQLRLDAKIANPTLPRLAVTGDFRASGLDGTLGVEAQLGDHSDLAVHNLSVKAAGGAIDGDLTVDLANLLTNGTLNVRFPDLAPWSRLAGMPLAGNIVAQARLAAQRGQAADLTLSGNGLASGSGAGRMALGHIAVTAKIADALGTPSASGEATLADIALSSGTIAKASLNLDSGGPGRFTFRADANGNIQAPLTVAVGGTAEL
ncbi:MAG: hypothetical protein JO305_01760, partial [Alphaproteobacteria bacterium]|nr:hypothetical protein [Alphaproteobacteria bacterium]